MLSSIRARAVSACLLACLPAVASAQVVDPDRQPIGRFAADVRGAWGTLPDDPALAAALDVTEDNLATRALGLVFGAHAYPLRLGQYVALGFGGELLFARGRNTVEVEEGDEAVAGPTVTARFSAVSPQVSLNFGGRDGWSYVSGGFGWSKYSTKVDPVPEGAPTGDEETPRASTINYGGGARWFMKKHLAFSLDLRFYTIRPQETSTRTPLGRTRLIVLNAGVSFR
jgi:hypothetical protein